MNHLLCHFFQGYLWPLIYNSFITNTLYDSLSLFLKPISQTLTFVFRIILLNKIKLCILLTSKRRVLTLVPECYDRGLFSIYEIQHSRHFL